MKTKLFATMLGLAFLLPSLIQADTIMLEDFEDGTITYTGPADAVGDLPGSRDYYGRFGTGGATTPSATSYSNLQGSGYYGVEDSDGATGGDGPQDTVVLEWANIDTTNFDNISLSWFVAEDDESTNQDWDFDTSFLIELDIDGNGYSTVFAIEGEGAASSNTVPRVDTNLDGVGDGAEITDTFTQFMTNIGSANSVSIRVTFDELTAQDEDLAFDELHLEGDLVSAVPEPGTALLFSSALIGCFYRRRRA